MTAFSTIYELFLSSIQDYELQAQFTSSPDIAEYKLKSWLLLAIPHFHCCIKDLTNYDSTGSQFNLDLDLDEQVILSELMVLSWYDYQNNDLLAMVAPLQDTDFKFSNHYQSYLASLEAQAKWREKVNNDITNYSLKHYPIESWGESDGS